MEIFGGKFPLKNEFLVKTCLNALRPMCIFFVQQVTGYDVEQIDEVSWIMILKNILFHQQFYF